VARRLELPFVDSDRVIESRAGCTIASLFEHEGEAAFREREAEVLASLVEAGRSVIATGGGAVLRGDNRELLRSRTVCVFLNAGHDLLWKRLRRDRRRPLLQVADPEARLRALSAERDPLYRETAHIVVETEGLPFGRLVDEVVRRVAAEDGR
jgi:shikimate kinase